MAEWRGCGGLEQRGRSVSLAMHTLGQCEVLTGACVQIAVLGWLVGLGRRWGTGGQGSRWRYRPAGLVLSGSKVLGEYRDSLSSAEHVLCPLCVTHRALAYGGALHI